MTIIQNKNETDRQKIERQSVICPTNNYTIIYIKTTLRIKTVLVKDMQKNKAIDTFFTVFFVQLHF